VRAYAARGGQTEGFCQNSEKGLSWRSFSRYAENNDLSDEE
jgi:hypothetical protein